MEFSELVQERKSVRIFKQEPVPKDEVLEIISKSVFAANAGNQQMWHFYVVNNKEIIAKMAELVRIKLEELAAKTGVSPQELKPVINSATFFAKAPAVIVVSTRSYRSKADWMLKETGYSDLEIGNLRCRPDLQSIGAAIQNLLMAAWEKGYGTCWMTAPCTARPALESFLRITEPDSIAALIPIGRPEIVPASRGRKEAKEVTTFID